MFNVANFAETTLKVSLGPGDSTIEIVDGSNFIEPPCLVIITVSRSYSDLKYGEILQIASPTGDPDVFNIIRNDPKTFNSGALVLGAIFAEHIQELQSNVVASPHTNLFLRLAHGTNESGIIRTGNADLKVQADVGLRVSISPGYCFVVNTPIAVELTQYLDIDSSTFTRCDRIEINTDGNISVNKGIDSSPPELSPNSMSLALITITNGQTQVEEIQDDRTFY